MLGECGASGPQGERNVVCLHIVTSAGEGLKVCVCVCVGFKEIIIAGGTETYAGWV